jgi:hypothetical protein
MAKVKEYRANAARAFENAKIAADPESRDQFLRIAQMWLIMSGEATPEMISQAPSTAPSSLDLRR